MKKTGAALLAAAALLVAGCSSGDDTDKGSTTSLCAASPTWDNPQIEAALSGVELPDGGRFDDSQTLTAAGNPGKLDVIVRICVPGLVGDPLKETATRIGYALKQSPVNDEIVSLRVSNRAEDSNPEGRVKAAHYDLSLFNPHAAEGANLAAWEHTGN